MHARPTRRSYNPIIKTLARRLSAAGKPFKVVMTACMRKLLTMLNTMVRNAQPWNPEYAKCQNNPERQNEKQPEKSIQTA